MELGNLHPNVKTKTKKRVGRGISSGLGKTSGRPHQDLSRHCRPQHGRQTAILDAGLGNTDNHITASRRAHGHNPLD